MFIIFFKNIYKTDVDKVGGKAASLGEMIHHDIPVPNGFAITTEAYNQFKQNGFSHESQEMILDAFDKLHSERVAIRSSAVAEDSSEASWAGQLESFLNIRRENVIENVKKCWDSIEATRVKAYSNKQKIDADNLQMAVVVQEMIDSEISGVMFTVNPINYNQNELMIEAGYGLGELIVQGEIIPDNIVASKDNYTVISQTIGSKDHMMIFANGDNSKEEVPDEKKQIFALKDTHIKQLIDLGIKTENLYNCPQDIEWAINQEGIYILQARPITTKREAQSQTILAKHIPLLKGIGAAFGVASGKARIITSMKQIEQIQEGEILVSPTTTPDFMAVFGKIKAVVTDQGGIASHAAIVARELGIPAVVGCKDATINLKTGDMITVDGVNGQVYQGDVMINITQKPKQSNFPIKRSGNEIDDLITAMIGDQIDTREFWPLSPGQLMPYFDMDQAIDMYDKLKFLIEVEKLSFHEIAKLFKRPELLRFYIINTGIVGFKTIHLLNIRATTIEDQVTYVTWLLEILKCMVQEDYLCLEGKNIILNNQQALNYIYSNSFIQLNQQSRKIISLLNVNLFTFNWSFYGDYYGSVGMSIHGPYILENKQQKLIIKEFFAPPSRIWPIGLECPFQHLVLSQIYENTDIYINYVDRIQGQDNITKHNISFSLVVDDVLISDESKILSLNNKLNELAKKQINFVNSLTDMDKVRKFAKLAYIAHEDFYKTFSDVWYPDQVIEKSIEILGNRFLLNNKATVNRDIDFRKRIWDPRNYEMP